MTKKYPNILLINETEGNADVMALLCHFLKMHAAYVTARFPVFEYISHSIKVYAYDYVVIDCESSQKGFELAHTLAFGFRKQPIILIDKKQNQCSHYPTNFHIFKTLEEGAQHIKEDS